MNKLRDTLELFLAPYGLEISIKKDNVVEAKNESLSVTVTSTGENNVDVQIVTYNTLHIKYDARDFNEVIELLSKVKTPIIYHKTNYSLKKLEKLLEFVVLPYTI